MKVFHKNCGKLVEKTTYFLPNVRNFMQIRQFAQYLGTICNSLKINKLRKALKINKLHSALIRTEKAVRFF
jgi:hypothetical protein